MIGNIIIQSIGIHSEILNLMPKGMKFENGTRAIQALDEICAYQARTGRGKSLTAPAHIFNLNGFAIEARKEPEKAKAQTKRKKA